MSSDRVPTGFKVTPEMKHALAERCGFVGTNINDLVLSAAARDLGVEFVGSGRSTVPNPTTTTIELNVPRELWEKLKDTSAARRISLGRLLREYAAAELERPFPRVAAV